MARIFKVQVNIDDMCAELDTLRPDQHAEWLAGFRCGCRGIILDGMDGARLMGAEFGKACHESAEAFRKSRVAGGKARQSAHAKHDVSTCSAHAQHLTQHDGQLSNSHYPVASIQQSETKDTVAVAPMQESIPCVAKPATPEEPDELWDAFWDAYGKKSGKQASMKAWSKLSPDDRQAAYDGVAGYLILTPDVKYRKDPERYLKHRVWEDEAVSDAGKVPDPFPLPTPERARYALGLTDVEPNDGWRGGK